ncbi:DNA polymerase III subunit delta' [Bacilli bacterium]|nr:DNA polymerase III subunit delta' [Bacilli bacterium]
MIELYGFDQTQEEIVRSIRNSQLHHCNLINGTRGIGKNCFVRNMACIALSVRHGGDYPTELEVERTNKLINSGGHTDLVTLNINTMDEDGKENTSKKSEINVKQVRKVIEEVKLTQSIAENKVMIVDSIDMVNVNGQNALLKTLEEPSPNTYIFLVCHNIQKVLNTVQSRCNIINVPDLTLENWQKAFRKVYGEKIKYDDSSIKDLYNLSGHSVGLAIDITNNNVIGLQDEIIESIFTKDIIKIQKLAESVYSNEVFNLFKIFLDRFFENMIYCQRTKTDNNLFGKNDKLVKVHLEKGDIRRTIENYERSKKIIHDMETYNLDRKHCITVMLNDLTL